MGTGMMEFWNAEILDGALSGPHATIPSFHHSITTPAAALSAQRVDRRTHLVRDDAADERVRRAVIDRHGQDLPDLPRRVRRRHGPDS